MKKILSLFFFLILSYSSLFAVVKTSIASGNYNNPAIWSPAGVPGSFDDVVISTGNTVTLTSNVIVRNIDIKSGAVLNGGNFRVEFNIWGILVYTNNGTHNVNIGTSALYFNNAGLADVDGSGIINGNIELNSGGPNFLATCNLTINGDFLANGAINSSQTKNDGNIIINGNITIATNIFVFNNGSILQIGGTGRFTNLSGNAFINNVGTFNTTGSLNLTQGNFFNSGLAIISGDLIGVNTTISQFNQLAGSYVKFGSQVFPAGSDGSLIVSGAGYEPNTVEYNGPTNQIIKNPSSLLSTYSNLIISNNNTKSLSAATTINGDLTITGNAQLDVASNYQLILKGNWINTSTHTDPFVERSGLVTFSGNIPQTISTNLGGGETFFRLRILNTSTGLTQLNNDINVKNRLQLMDGLIHTGIYETNITTASSVGITNFSTASYIDGNLRRSVPTSSVAVFNFPVGNNNAYELAAIKFIGAHTVGNLLVNFSNLPAGTGLPLTEGSATYSTILNCGGSAPGTGNTNDGVWTITPNTGTANYDLTLYGRNYSNAAAGNTIVKRANLASAWSLLGGYVASTGNEPLIAQRTGFSGFSQFAIGSSEIALPIELTSFTANCQHNGVLLNWTTASEINNDFFTIEKSVDAVNWDEIGNVLGAGNSNEFLNYSFIDDNVHTNQVTYYQLKQTDFDGKSKTFNITPINCNSDKEPIIYPTLAAKHINIDSEKQPITEYNISDLTGTVVLKKKYDSDSKLKQVKVNIQAIPKGIYVITILSEKNVYAFKFIKE